MRRFYCPVFRSAPAPKRSSPKSGGELLCNLQSPPNDNVHELMNCRPSGHKAQYQSVLDQEIYVDKITRSSSGAPVPQDDNPAIEPAVIRKTERLF